MVKDKLTEVKARLGITGNYQDSTLNGYIDDVKQYLLSAGVKQEVIDSDKSIGCIARGVIDLWNYGQGGTLSNYFMQRAIQLTAETVEETTASTV